MSQLSHERIRFRMSMPKRCGKLQTDPLPKIRKMWALHNFDSQEGLFIGAEEVPIRMEHLAVLVHSPAGRHKNQAAFVDVVIPDRNLRRYNERIPLFEMFPKEAEEYRAMFKQKKRRGEGTARNSEPLGSSETDSEKLARQGDSRQRLYVCRWAYLRQR
jgi:hypothetical protein